MDGAPLRLKRRRDFLHLARTGRKWAAPGLVLQAKLRPEGRETIKGTDTASVRIGFTVSRKVGNAVIRNRARRRLKAAAENIFPAHGMPGFDYVVIGRAATPKRPWAALQDDMVTALKKVGGWREDEELDKQ
ncbi:MAG: ribonuclease P protein component [Rhodospirillaceae bacterium]|jgi:ribonuclease P protein component|nr:ribonuclease P protein component [Rhodospirillaceae bacterium]